MTEKWGGGGEMRDNGQKWGGAGGVVTHRGQGYIVAFGTDSSGLSWECRMEYGQ